MHTLQSVFDTLDDLEEQFGTWAAQAAENDAPVTHAHWKAAQWMVKGLIAKLRGPRFGQFDETLLPKYPDTDPAMGEAVRILEEAKGRESLKEVAQPYLDPSRDTVSFLQHVYNRAMDAGQSHAEFVVGNDLSHEMSDSLRRNYEEGRRVNP